jgi:hypothetical protein
MENRTGMCGGTLRPVIYFVRKSDMYAILAPTEIGSGIEMAKKAFELKYKHDWAWCEASTLQEVDVLQKRLANQDIFDAEQRVQLNTERRDRIYKKTGDALRQRMVSSQTTAWEKDFIRAYIDMRNNKRDKYRDALLHRNRYIFAREQDENKNIADVLPVFEGQYERAGV